MEERDPNEVFRKIATSKSRLQKSETDIQAGGIPDKGLRLRGPESLLTPHLDFGQNTHLQSSGECLLKKNSGVTGEWVSGLVGP